MEKEERKVQEALGLQKSYRCTITVGMVCQGTASYIINAPSKKDAQEAFRDLLDIISEEDIISRIMRNNNNAPVSIGNIGPFKILKNSNEQPSIKFSHVQETLESVPVSNPILNGITTTQKLPQ